MPSINARMRHLYLEFLFGLLLPPPASRSKIKKPCLSEMQKFVAPCHQTSIPIHISRQIQHGQVIRISVTVATNGKSFSYDLSNRWMKEAIQ